MSKEIKILPELRFPDFTNNDQWKADTVQNIVTTKSPPKKLQSSEYLDEGVFPIIDQSQSFYCGYTNDQQAIINEDLPLVIFGDHTCALKMAREPFAQGADGIKILKSKAFIDPEYLYQYLTYNGVKQENYKRHYSKLKEKIVPYPEFESGEQQKIASCLSSLDELLAAHKDKLDALKDHKKGLLQNLFPQEGETVPKVRFSEFEGDGEWVERKLGEVFNTFSGGTPKSTEKKYYGGSTPFIRSAEIAKNSTELFLTDEGLKNSSAKLVKKGDLLIALYGANSGDVAISKIDGAINQAILCLRSDFSNEFVSHYFFLKKDWITRRYLQGGQGNLSGQIVKSIELYFPKQEEQQKIASCLSAVDELITAQQEKIDELQQHKKGLMQGLFPKIKS